MQVSKWGNSLAVRLPAAVVEVLEQRVESVHRRRILGNAAAAVTPVRSAPGGSRAPPLAAA